MRFDEITLSTLRDKFGPVDGFADIWCNIMRLKFLWQQYKNDGRIGPLLQSQCDELVSALEQISELPEPSRFFQAMLDVAVGHATQLVGNSPSSESVNSTIQGDDAFTTPNMSPAPGVAKTLEWSPATNVRREPQDEESNSEKAQVRKRKSDHDQGNFIERRARYEEFAINYIKDVFGKENARRIQAQQEQMSPTDLMASIPRGRLAKTLGISRDCIAERYSQHCPDETPDTIKWFHANKPRGKYKAEDLRVVTLKFLCDKAFEGLQRDAMANEDKTGKHGSTDVAAAEDEDHAEDVADAADTGKDPADAEKAEDPSKAAAKKAKAAEADSSANKPVTVPAEPAEAGDVAAAVSPSLSRSAAHDAPRAEAEGAEDPADAEKAEAEAEASKDPADAEKAEAEAEASKDPADAEKAEAEAEAAKDPADAEKAEAEAEAAKDPADAEKVEAEAEAAKDPADAEKAEADRSAANKPAVPADATSSSSQAGGPAAPAAGSFTDSVSAATEIRGCSRLEAGETRSRRADSKRAGSKTARYSETERPVAHGGAFSDWI